MSTTIDDRIVMMKFDNNDFERNAQTSMSTLDLLKQKLDFSNVRTGLESIDTSYIKSQFDRLGDIDSSKLENVLDRMEYRMSSMGIFVSRIVENVADSVFSIVQKALSGIESIINFAEGGIVQGGYSRASNIQSAKFQLEGLGIAWDDIKDDIDYAVKNTAYALDQAAIVASKLTSSGLKPGEQYIKINGEETDIDTMAMVLRGISGTAAATGGKAGYAEIGNIFSKMISYGKVNLQQLNELGTYGIGATGILADYFNKIKYKGKSDWAESDIRGITSSRSEILDPMVVIEAMYEKFGEHAVKANETLTGVMANTKSALARIGENFFTPIIENGGPLVHLFEALRQSINALNEVISPVVKSFGNLFANYIEKIAGKFIEKRPKVDSEGNVIYDEEGNPEYEWKLKKPGGIFAPWFEPWSTEAVEWKEFDDSIRSNIPEGGQTGSYVVPEMTRAAKVLDNIGKIIVNSAKLIFYLFDNINKAIQQVFPNWKGFADLAVRVTTAIANGLERLANSKFLQSPVMWKDSGMYAIIRGLAAGVDIIIRFGASFKKHILDPIFKKGASLVAKSPLGDWLVDIANKIWDFDQKIKETDDYFGPFIEKMKTKVIEIKDVIVEFAQNAGPKIKEFIDYIKPKLEDLFTNIANWWAPVKDILFDSDLTIKEKLQSIKDYFSENFSLPGWEKAKDIFGKIKDSISGIIDKIKEFFGIGGKEEDTLGLTTAASGLVKGAGGGGGLYGIRGKMATNDLGISVSDVLNIDTLDKETEKMPSIADRIANFFSKMKETFSGIDFTGPKALLTAFIVVIILLIGTLTWAISRVPKLLKAFTSTIPELIQKILNNFNSLLFGLTETLHAQRWEHYSGILKNIAIAVGILAGAFAIMSGVIFLMNKYGQGKDLVESMKEAGVILGSMVATMTGVLSVLMLVTKSFNSMSVAWNPVTGFNLSLPGTALLGLQQTLKALVISLVGISALVVVLGLIPDGIFESGADKLQSIAWNLVVMVGVLSVTSFVLSGLLGLIKVTAFGVTLAAIAALLTSFTAAIFSIIVAISILGLISQTKFGTSVFESGLKNFEIIAWSLVGLTGVLLVMSAIASAIGAISAGTIAASMFGIASIIFAISTAVLLIGISMTIISKAINNFGDWISTISALVIIALALTAVPSILMVILADTKDATKFSKGDLFGLATMILAMGGAILMMSKGLAALNGINITDLIWYFAILEGFIATFAGIYYALKDVDDSKMTKVALSMFAMTGVVAVMGTLLSILSSVGDFSRIGPVALVLGGALLVIGGLVFAIGKFIRFDESQLNNVTKFTSAMAYLALSLLPFALALTIVSNTFKNSGLNLDEFKWIVASLGAAILALGLAVIAISHFSANGGTVSLDAVIAIISLAFALIPVAGAVSLIGIAMKGLNLQPLELMAIMAGLTIVVLGLGLAVSKMGEAMSHIGSLKVGQMLTLTLGIVGAIIGIAGAIGVLAFIVGKTNLDALTLGMVAVVVIAVAATVYQIVKYLNDVAAKMVEGFDHSKEFVELLAGYVVITASLFGLAVVLAMLSTLNIGKLWNAFAVLGVTGFLVLGLTYLCKQISDGMVLGGTQERLLSVILGYVAISGSLLILGTAVGVLAMLPIAEMWSAVGAIAALGFIITIMTAIMSVIADKQGADDVVDTILMYIGAAGSLFILSLAVVALSRVGEDRLWDSVLALGAMAVVITAMSAIVSLMGGNIHSVIGLVTGILSYISISASLVILAKTLIMLKDMPIEDIRDRILWLGGALSAMATIAGLLSAFSGGLAALGMAAFGGMCLGVAAALAAAGFVFMAAETAINSFIGLFEKLRDDPDLFKDGMVTLNEGLAEGFISGLSILKVKLPQILGDIGVILDTLGGFIIERMGAFVDFLHSALVIIFDGVADIAEDDEIKVSLARIIQSILDFAEGNATDWAEQAGRIAAKIVTGFISGLTGVNILDILTGGGGNGSSIPDELKNKLTGDYNNDLSIVKGYLAMDAKYASDLNPRALEDRAKEILAELNAGSSIRENIASGLTNYAKGTPMYEQAAGLARLFGYDDLTAIGDAITLASQESELRGDLSPLEQWENYTKGLPTSNKYAGFNPLMEMTKSDALDLIHSLSPNGDLNKLLGDGAESVISTYDSKYKQYTTPHGAMNSAPSLANVFGGLVSQGLSSTDSSVESGEIGTEMGYTAELAVSKFGTVLGASRPIGNNPFLTAISSNLAESIMSVLTGDLSSGISNLTSTVATKTNSSFADKTSGIGENITAGIMDAMTNTTSVNYISNSAKGVCGEVIKQIKKAFGIHSPAETMMPLGEMNTAGIAYGMTDSKALSYIEDSSDTVVTETEDYYQVRTAKNNAMYASGKNMTESYAAGMEEGLGSLDLGSIYDTVTGNVTKKVPDLKSLIPEFGLDKGIEGNLDELKNSWNKITSIFKDDEGNFDLSWMFDGVSDQLQGKIDGLLGSLGLDQESINKMIEDATGGMDMEAFDTSSFGISADALDLENYDKWVNDFGAFNASALDTNELDIKVVIDRSEYDNFIKDNTTQTLAAKVPSSPSYRQSTAGNGMQVSNYTYNQNNTSTSPLSSREVARQTSLALQRNKWRTRG